MKSPLLRLARIALLVYVGLCIGIAGCQSTMLYFPAKHTEPAALARASDGGLEPWRDAHGMLIGWKRPVARAKARMLVFHGNAGFALDRTYYADAFGAGWEVCILEYPGYGSRDGSPGKESFIAAGRAAVENLLATDKRPVFLLGESIGSGPAAALAGAMPEKIAGAVMMIPFARLAEVAKAKFPWLPVSLLLRDKFDNIAALGSFHGPVVFVIAEDDEVIGPAQGRKFHTAYAGPKKLIVLPGATHNNFPTEPDALWFRETSDFLRKHEEIPGR
jgi:pimeloyl-ACP methyl ester carboxylesterase